jgi:hypothetical protein
MKTENCAKPTAESRDYPVHLMCKFAPQSCDGILVSSIPPDCPADMPLHAPELESARNFSLHHRVHEIHHCTIFMELTIDLRARTVTPLDTKNFQF